jgi:hypothetical protein
MLKQVTFNGPCKGWTIVRIEGVLLAPSDPFFATDQWINFRYVKNLIVSGPGSLDGQGSSAWRVNKNHNRPNLPIVSSFPKSIFYVVRILLLCHLCMWL